MEMEIHRHGRGYRTKGEEVITNVEKEKQARKDVETEDEIVEYTKEREVRKNTDIEEKIAERKDVNEIADTIMNKEQRKDVVIEILR